MKKILLGVNENTFEIHTLDGAKYKVEPGDITICCTWTPTMELEIDSRKKLALLRALVKLYISDERFFPWTKTR